MNMPGTRECGNLDRAIDFNQQSAEQAHKRSEAETIANAELNLADIFLAQGDLVLAQELIESIEKLVRNPATSDWMKWRYSTHLFASLSELRLAQGDATWAQESIHQCLDIATRTNAQKYLVKGWRLQGQAELMLGNHSEAGAWLQKALSLARRVGNPTQLWQTYIAMGHLQAAGKQSEPARVSYLAARDVVDGIRVRLENADLRENLDQSPLIQQVYDLSS